MDPSNETLANQDNSSIPVEVEGMSPMMRTIFYCLYAIVFILAFVGNNFALITCYKTYKITTSVLLCYIASLASADLMFTLLSIFDLIAFIGKGDWFGGNPVCKIQSFLIESCYTVSILTLVAISYERLKAVSSPVLARAQRTTERTIILKVIWVIGVASCGPLLYAYYVKKEETTGKSLCVNENMGDIGRQIYYAIQAGLLFLLPLGFMSWAHVRIFQHLSSHVKTRKTLTTDRDGLKQRKVTKMLALVTLVFFICYGPFMVIRALRYFYIYNGDVFWRLGQMMIFGQAAVNPIIYCFYSKQFRFSFKDLLRCRFSTKETNRLQKLRSSSTRSSSSLKSSQNTLALNEFCAAGAQVNRV